VLRETGRTVAVMTAAPAGDRLLTVAADDLRDALTNGVAAYVGGPVWQLVRAGVPR
jgi:hypothetical protein